VILWQRRGLESIDNGRLRLEAFDDETVGMTGIEKNTKYEEFVKSMVASVWDGAPRAFRDKLV
jgi:hypothetical protein